jgi:GNAT superfamily N-acetyltransferase
MIRIAEKSDLPEILAVQRVAFYQIAALYDNFMIHPLRVGLATLESGFEDYVYLIKVEGGRILGAIRGRAQGDCLKVENLVVLPQHQRKGVGAALLEALELRFPQCAKALLFTGQDTSGNLEFYQKRGYQVVGQTPPSEWEPLLLSLEKNLQS